MTQGQLSKQAGLSKTTVSNLESGRLKRIELATIAKLCKALECTVTDLFELSDQAEFDIVQRQRRAIKSALGSLTFDRPVIAQRLMKTPSPWL